MTGLRKTSRMACLAIFSLLPFFGAQAADRIWAKATGTGDWFTAANWDGGSTYPTNGDTVAITNGGVLLTNSTALLASFSITNATLIFSNWNTTVNATNVIVRNGGIMTLPPAFTTSQMSNNIYVICSNFTLNAGGQILADAKGYAKQNGPGKGTDGDRYMYSSGGGGYGGRGGTGCRLWMYANRAGGESYGSSLVPLAPGSGGGGSKGGAGGGAVRIESCGTVTIDGTVAANGGASYSDNEYSSGGGSGGAIYINCTTFGGSAYGILNANGGVGYSNSGAGGGGRITVNYVSVDANPGVRFSANCGAITKYFPDANAADQTAPQVGTLNFPNATLMDKVLEITGGSVSGMNGYVFFESTNVWNPKMGVLSNSTLGIPEGYSWQITNNLTVVTGGVVVAAQATLSCGGNLTLANGANLIVYSGQTNAVHTNSYGTWVEVLNTLTLESNCWMYPFSDGTNGGSVLLRVGSLAIRSGGGIDAVGRGYMRVKGPGKGTSGDRYNYDSSGGGYGGKGGSGTYAGGGAYGSTNLPFDPGSGGGGLYGGHGGGAIRIEARYVVTMDGTVTANGGSSSSGAEYSSAGGSGGAIYLICSALSGSTNGILRADGGNGYVSAGGGGGGRIAVWIGVSDATRQKYLAGLASRVIRSKDRPPGYLGLAPSVTNGTGYLNPPDVAGAYPGTYWFFTEEPSGGIMVQIQ